MSTEEAIEEIWEMFRETDRRIEQRLKETDRRFAERDGRLEEMERILDRAERIVERTDRQMEETDRQIKETARQMRETDRKMQETMTQLGQLGNRLGEFVEYTVKPGVLRLFRERGMDVGQVYPNLYAESDGMAAEVDLLVKDKDICIVVEAKSRLSVEDVDEHTDRMSKFKRLFDEYADRRAFGALAAIVLPDDVARYAYRQGFFVITAKGEDLVILNDENFVPAEW